MVQDSGTNSHDIHIVRGGGTKPNRHWDTVSTIAQAWLEANPGSRKSHVQVMRDIIRMNNLKDGDGRDCLGRENTAVIRRGQRLRIPEGNELGVFPEVQEANCVEKPPEKDILLFTTPENTTSEITGPAPQAVRVKLPDYPTTGNNTNNNAPQIQSVANLDILLGKNREQPNPAARGVNRNGTGIQTVVGTAGEVANYGVIALFSAATIPVGGANVNLVPLAGTSVANSADRRQFSRQGSETTSQDTAGKNWRIDNWPFNGQVLGVFAPSDRTRHDATLLPVRGITLNDRMQVVDATGEGQNHNNNNQFYNVINENGSFDPSITSSQRQVETGRPNRFLQGQPSAPVSLNGFNNYAVAQYVNQESLLPQLNATLERYYANPNAQDAQRAVELLNYQQTLVGISNYGVNADLSQPLTQEQVQRLNPREQIVYMRNGLVAQAAAQNIQVDANKLPQESPVRSVPRAVIRDNMVDYYTELAMTKPGVFRDVVKDEFDYTPRYSARNEQEARAAATRYVEELPFIRALPENGASLDWIDSFVSTRDQNARTDITRDNFTAIERREWEPATPTNDRKVVGDALGILADNPRFVGRLLADSGNPSRDSSSGDVGEAWAAFDNARINLPKFYVSDRVRWDRAAIREDLRARGYSEERMENLFNREEAPVLNDFQGISDDLRRSANDPAIVAMRQDDLRAAAAVDNSAPGMQMLYAIAQTVPAAELEEYIRETSPTPEVAAQRIEIVKQAVKYTDNNISRDMLGNSVDDIAVEVAAKSVISPGVANVSGGTRRQETVEQRSTVVEANVQTFFTHLASKPAAAQAFVQGVNGNSAVANPAFEHAQQLLQSATRLSPADQAEVVRSILADRTVSQGLGLTATAASVTPENAGALLQSVVEASTREPLKTIGAVSAIARNPRASAVLVGGLAGQPQLASSLSGTLQPAQQAEIITKANLENTNVWTSIAPQTTTHTTVRTTQVADFTNVRGAEGFVSAARQTEPRAQAVAFAKEALTNQSTRAEALESVIERDPKFATAAVVQTLSQDSELANDVLRNLRREGGRKHPGLLGWRKLTSSHPQAKLAGLIDDVLDARNDQDRAKAAEKLDAMLNSDKPDDKAAVADFFAAAQNTTTRSGVNGGDALRTTLVNALDGSQVNPNVPPLANFSLTGDQTVALLFNSALTLDNTNASDLAQSTFEFIGRSMTRTGFIIPYIPIITTREKPPIDQDVPRDQVPCCEPVPPRPRPLPEQNPGLPQPQGRQ